MSVCRDITIAEINDVAVNQQVCVTGKVVSVDSPENVKAADGRTLRMQAVYLAGANVWHGRTSWKAGT